MALPPEQPERRSFLRRAALYPDLYTWYVFVSSIDILFTWLILTAGGHEVNALAAWVVRTHNVPGLVVFKFGTVVFVVLVCETIGRRKYQAGVKLARWAVVISGFPVVVGAAHLLRVALGLVG